jgi:hypothetical protein
LYLYPNPLPAGQNILSFSGNTQTVFFRSLTGGGSFGPYGVNNGSLSVTSFPAGTYTVILTNSSGATNTINFIRQ